MTYLTQVTLDFATAARLRLRDSYDWHQAVWKAFPGRDWRATRFPHSPRLASGRFSAVDRVARGARAARLVSSPTRRAGRRSRSPKRISRAAGTRFSFAQSDEKGHQACPRRQPHQERSPRPTGHARGARGLAQPKGCSRADSLVDEDTLRLLSAWPGILREKRPARSAQCRGISGRAHGERPDQIP